VERDKLGVIVEDRFALTPQWQHPRRAARLKGGENEYGQPGISCAFPVLRTVVAEQ
jgi:hypothetical protein